MPKTGKQYIVPFRTDEDRVELRKWMGQHNGMSIMKSDWGYHDDMNWHDVFDAYVIKITNPKTELLFVLAFPDAKDISGLNRNADHDWRHLPNRP